MNNEEFDTMIMGIQDLVMEYVDGAEHAGIKTAMVDTAGDVYIHIGLLCDAMTKIHLANNETFSHRDMLSSAMMVEIIGQMLQVIVSRNVELTPSDVLGDV